MDVEYISDFEIVIYATTGVTVPLKIEDLTFISKVLSLNEDDDV